MSKINMELLDILLDLSDKKEIKYSRKQLEKFTDEKLEQIHEEYKRRELDEFNEAMTDMFISKLDEYFKKWEFIKSDSNLGKKLQDKKLFRKDLKSVIGTISPYLPFIGIMEGSVTIITEIVEKFAENKDDKYQEESIDPGETQS